MKKLFHKQVYIIDDTRADDRVRTAIKTLNIKVIETGKQVFDERDFSPWHHAIERFVKTIVSSSSLVVASVEALEEELRFRSSISAPYTTPEAVVVMEESSEVGLNQVPMRPLPSRRDIGSQHPFQ